MTIDLYGLERLANAATPGPWSTKQYGPDRCEVLLPNGFSRVISDPTVVTDCDSRFIAAANPTTVLALVERLRKAENALRGAASFVQSALRHAEWCEAGRKGMHVPYHGPFAQAVSSPAVVRDLRELERIINAGLEGK